MTVASVEFVREDNAHRVAQLSPALGQIVGLDLDPLALIGSDLSSLIEELCTACADPAEARAQLEALGGSPTVQRGVVLQRADRRRLVVDLLPTFEEGHRTGSFWLFRESMDEDAEILRAIVNLHESFSHHGEAELSVHFGAVVRAFQRAVQGDGGFIGEIVHNHGEPALRTWAVVGGTTLDEVRGCRLTGSRPGSLASLCGEVLAGEPVLREAVPELGLPPFVGIPLSGRAGVLGVLGIIHGRSLDVAKVRAAAAGLGHFLESLGRDRGRRKVELEARERIERLERLAHARAEFLSVMSHEIRTPLNAIVGVGHLLANEHPAEHQRDNLDALQFSAGNLLQLVDDVLDFARLEGGKFRADTDRVDLQELLSGVVQSHRTLAKDQGIELVLHFDGFPREVMTDRARLLQILSNLTNNAIKFTSRGSVMLEVHLVEERIMFSVEDTGIGIAEDRARLLGEGFDPCAVSEKRFAGTGLGLAICRRLIEQLGGELKVHSRVGEGSRFWFSIPAAIPLEAEEPLASVRRESLEGSRVLLIDDVPLNLRIGARLVESFGAKVDVASSGFEALSALSRFDYTVVLLDLHMPEMDGFETFTHIRARNHQTPVYALSADVCADTRSRVEAFGMEGLLPKPLAPATLRQVIARHAA